MPRKKSKSFDFKKIHTLRKRIEKLRKLYQNFEKSDQNQKSYSTSKSKNKAKKKKKAVFKVTWPKIK